MEYIREGSPNIVVDGRGRFIYQSHISREDFSNAMRSKVTELDANKTAVRVSLVPKTGINEEEMEVIVFNDSLEDIVYEVRLMKLLSDGVDVKVYYDGVEKDKIFDISVKGLGYVKLSIRFEISNTAKICSLSSVYFYVNASKEGVDTTSELRDACCATLMTQGCSYTDVEMQYEHFIKDKTVFPTSINYETENVVNAYIKSATEELVCFIRPLWRTNLSCMQLAKQYIIYKVLVNFLLRLSSYSVTGSQVWDTTIRSLRDELKVIESRILYYG